MARGGLVGAVGMIVPSTPVASVAVADHYDELDVYYRELWGEHVHHGLWRSGREPAAVAVVQLVEHLAARLRLRPGERLVDMGAGYGATARHLADRFDVEVTALTLSRAQHEFACASATPSGRTPRYLLGDWLRNGLPAASFDAGLAIESTEHMADKATAFAELRRVLRPGGRVAICAWIAREEPRAWEVRHLLEPICREGRLAGMGTEREYHALLCAAGFAAIEVEDLTSRVRGTWPRCARAVGMRLLRDGRARSFVASASSRNGVFAATILRIWAAYAVGAMRYLVFTARGPGVA